MNKSKVVIKQTGYTEDGLSYTSRHKGEDGVCFTMALGFACSLAKSCGMSLTKLTSLLKDMYRETESDMNDEN